MQLCVWSIKLFCTSREFEYHHSAKTLDRVTGPIDKKVQLLVLSHIYKYICCALLKCLGGVHRNVVTLEDGQELYFTHCLVAVGSLGPIPARSNQVSIALAVEKASFQCCVFFCRIQTMRLKDPVFLFLFFIPIRLCSILVLSFQFYAVFLCFV